MSRRTPFVAAALLAVLVAVVLVARSGDDAYRVRVVIADAAGLRKNSDVKVDGVPAGSVQKISLRRDDRAVLTLALDRSVAPIGRGAAAHVRPVNLLGEKYVDLQPGDRARPAPSGSVIPMSRTAAAVELDDVLNMLTPDTRGALRILINEAGITMAGRGTDLNALLDELPPSLDGIHDLLGQLAAERRTMRTMIAQGDRVIGAVAGRRDDLVRLVDTAQSALRRTAERRAQLGATLRAAPGAVDQLRDTLAELDRAAGALTPAARQLERTAAPLSRTLASLPAFTAAATPTLRQVGHVAPSLTTLGREGTPLVRRLRPTAERLAAFASDLAPLTRTFDQGGGLDALLGLMEGWAHTIKTSDGLGHVFRLRITFDDELLTSVLQRYGSPQGARKKRRPLLPTRPRPERPRPSRPAPAPVGPAGGPARALDAVTSVIDRVGDETERNIKPLLDYLLGG